MRELLANFPVVIPISIAWGDMDAMGHVNNTIYLRYFESARIAYFERLGFWQSAIGPILGSIQCKFKLPLEYPDTVLAGARVTQLDVDRFVMAHCVVSHRAQRIAAEGDGVIVAYDYQAKKKAQLPAGLAERIRELEASVGNVI